MKSVAHIVDEIFDLYDRFGEEDYIGEPVSQLAHMWQAAQLAIAGGYDDEVVLAAFFHDIGHICVMKSRENNMDGYGVTDHERAGAEFLKAMGFPYRVTHLVENHVAAKRYLTFKQPSYYQALSEASKETLTRQGGMMSREEADAFEKDPLFELSLQLRQWDEQAKETNFPAPDLNALKEKARRLLLQNR